MRAIGPLALIAIMTTSLLAPPATAGENIPDSTGWHRVNNGTVVVQTVESAKLPKDTLIVNFTDRDRPPLVVIVNRNVFLTYESMAFRGRTIVARIPTAIRWYRTTFHRQVEWSVKGPTTTVVKVSANLVKDVTYRTHDGREWNLNPVDPDRLKPMYWPSLIPTEEELKKPKKKK